MGGAVAPLEGAQVQPCVLPEESHGLLVQVSSGGLAVEGWNLGLLRCGGLAVKGWNLGLLRSGGLAVEGWNLGLLRSGGLGIKGWSLGLPSPPGSQEGGQEDRRQQVQDHGAGDGCNTEESAARSHSPCQILSGRRCGDGRTALACGHGMSHFDRAKSPDQ